MILFFLPLEKKEKKTTSNPFFLFRAIVRDGGPTRSFVSFLSRVHTHFFETPKEKPIGGEGPAHSWKDSTHLEEQMLRCVLMPVVAGQATSNGSHNPHKSFGNTILGLPIPMDGERNRGWVSERRLRGVCWRLS